VADHRLDDVGDGAGVLADELHFDLAEASRLGEDLGRQDYLADVV